ncbi:hypothetical protein LTR78_000824 [Recurvomyces mirabilis]|uniref:DUF7626 domain-containing protein n=1 Tax=Recurvomyces mirabilis TaxID=574656 RepID=A0AAE0WWM7_9PEZI|nr:hypothetical protein LTR78_000824 [Recurvomyces mirabilis]KAK5158793.1 hypothetical protein LTS14_002901 [Recurvomyces mirabilis]
MVARTLKLLFAGTLPNESEEASGNDDTPTNVFDDSDAKEDVYYENPQTGEHSILKRAHSPSTSHRPTKGTRVQGGKAAVPKRILADYDSDDGRIIHLKQQGFSDEYVAQSLIQEGRIRYVPKTVGSRWLRLRKALEKAEEERLDDELSDWHAGEDAKLEASFALIEKNYQDEMGRITEKKWKAVADDLALRMGTKKKYTHTACRERHHGLESGEALLPIEIDQDQEGRRVLRETRIAAAKQRQIDEAAEQQRLEDEKKAKSEAKKVMLQEKEDLRVAAQLRKMANNAEQAQLRAERNAEKERMTVQKRIAQEKLARQIDWAKAQKVAEKAILKQFGLKVKATQAKKTVKGKGSRKRRASSLDDGSDGSDADDEKTMVTFDDGDVEASAHEDYDEDVVDDYHSMLGDDIADVRDLTPIPKPPQPLHVAVTRNTLEDPRSIMTLNELDVLLTTRKMPARTAAESQPQIVARVCAADEALSTTEQFELLQSYLESKKGSKAARLHRIATYEAKAGVAALQGIKATDPEFKRSYEGYKGQYASLLEE